ncbi:S9 family peptidase [Carnimonas nigrificans]|uniref:S9 family peptidase n=1 Tax=Carnimonas nigrificans TaxID=64323 RepID=UPI00047243E8|nr:oligopeptidase B [Carnimonas nigrificans]
MTSSSSSEQPLTAPDAKQHSHTVTAPFGASRDDVYYWMRDDERKAPAIIDYLNQENDYADQLLAPLSSFRDTLYEELVARINQEESSVPYRKRGWWYYSRFIKGQDYPLMARRRDSDGLSAQVLMAAHAEQDFSHEQILLDQNQLAEGKEFFSLGAAAISPDTRLIAWAEDDSGRRQFRIKVKEVGTDEVIDTGIAGVSGYIVWANDSRTFLYIENDPDTLLTKRVKKHVLGSAAAEDQVIYEEHDNSFYLGLSKTRDERFITLVHFSTDTTEMRYTSADHPTELQPLAPREEGLRYDADHYAGRWVISTNADGADNFKLMSAPSACTSRSEWQTLLDYDPEVVIEDVELFDGFMAIAERSNGLERLRLLFDDGEQRYVSADEPAYSMGLAANPEPESTLLRYGYTSLTTPSTVYELDLVSGERRQLKQQHVAGYTPDNYHTERLWITVRDGTEVPVSLVYRKGFVKDGSAALYQYGYGSYGMPMDPGFSSTRISLLDRGVVFAIAHVRGGAELGRQWYDAGRLLNKQNTFNDFIDITRDLVRQGYASAERVAAAGGSAGGLLMGTVANQAPELYRVMEAQVPFVDIVTTMLDPTIPLTTNEYHEWGNPEQPAYYDYMLSYSPYDNVSAQAYPALYIGTGLWDSQVQYWEPAKWVAKLRDMNTGKRPLVFRTNMEAGHGGKSGRFKRYEELAESYAFVLAQLDAVSLIHE